MMITWKNYESDLREGTAQVPYLSELDNKSVLITGATGLIGSCLIDLLGYRNMVQRGTCAIYAVGRSLEKLKSRFPDFWDMPWFHAVRHDVRDPLTLEERVDHIINCASNAHPVLYAQDPVGTITTNVFGTYYLLEYAKRAGVGRVLEVSTVEIYGENRGDVEAFDEAYCGKLNCNTARGGYPESKRVSETLCHAYRQAHGLDVVIARPCRVYGPTMNMSDSKATAQFIKSALAGEDIVLKSTGDQLFSYAYVLDIATGLFTVLLRGTGGEAYNIADRLSVVRLRELAETAAEIGGSKVIYSAPDAVEKKGFSGAEMSVLDPSKLNGLGWEARTHLREGMKRTVEILRSLQA